MYSIRFFQNKIREEIAQRVCRRSSSVASLCGGGNMLGSAFRTMTKFARPMRGYRGRRQSSRQKRRHHHREREIRRKFIAGAEHRAHHDPDEHAMLALKS